MCTVKNQTDNTEGHLPSIAMTQWIYSVKDNDEYKNRDFKSLVVRTSVLTICIMVIVYAINMFKSNFKLTNTL